MLSTGISHHIVVIWLSLNNWNKDHWIAHKQFITVANCQTRRKMAFYLWTSCFPKSLYITFPLIRLPCGVIGKGERGHRGSRERTNHFSFLWCLPLNCYGYLTKFSDSTITLDLNALQGLPLFCFLFLWSTSFVTMVGFNAHDLVSISDIEFYSLLEYKLQVLPGLKLTRI